ncbi:HCP-like protein [Rhizodiscina lignyota]|uniref:HCP-like protein n=1 Tax=Rhizodiscina lignyota TaxID=1504668 RepID=A0A9P4M730_9PEZI|nr:HCP-like protein [Rhizodiscina lignyota]
MTLKDLLKKKDRVHEDQNQPPATREAELSPSVPEFTFMRTTTNTQEVITPPVYPGDAPVTSPPADSTSKRFSRFRRHTNASPGKNRASLDLERDERPKHDRRLSERLHLGRDHSASMHSTNVPDSLPDIQVEAPSPSDDAATKEEKEARWEKRATILAQSNPNSRRGSGSASANHSDNEEGLDSVSVGAAQDDGDIQDAIRLHEEGNLERSTAIFGKLADPNGANNALSQVLYGLALRHGWGITPNPQLAITYLSYAASNSAEVESLALAAGMKKGGSAKGELVLAIFELGNCFRNGWGVKKDPVAAKQYYETAANLGDTDAMNEVAWCYLEGFGTKKDKFKAAQYLRLAEEKGSKTIGNQW